ncbi:MAG: hypothetical protein D6793_08745 [Thermoflexia bacterium]|nr:MAG: hypothetical protein D6793_08745 [Thermoflexia bacterium]
MAARHPAHRQVLDGSAVPGLNVPLTVGDDDHGRRVVDGRGDANGAQNRAGGDFYAVAAKGAVGQDDRTAHREGVDPVLVGDLQVVPAADTDGIADEGLAPDGLDRVGDLAQKDGPHNPMGPVRPEVGLDGDIFPLLYTASQVQPLQHTLQAGDQAVLVVPAGRPRGCEVDNALCLFHAPTSQ